MFSEEAITMECNQDDIMLLQNIQTGSRQSFDIFYKKYYSFVYQIALHIVGDKLEAEDVSHDVFLEVFQKANQYNTQKGSIKAWLAVKTKSRSIDRLRKKRPLLVNRLEILLTNEEKAADLLFLLDLQKHILIDALNQIPKEQREAIIRSYFNGETHKEISIHMDKPIGSIKSLIRYGLNNLRKQKSLLNWVESGRGKTNEN